MIEHDTPDLVTIETVKWVADGCRAVELASGDGERAIAAMHAAGATILDGST